ncbi:hypothetical protein GQ55_9G048700 [Panicum hallii var. hallii]|uniref:Uncharacterized protein n=1 Tax=Panicum hallii var. hallii TaxID=1504633 RepID=A0A2T7BZP5_9POAL|nr:hypothetical protein GQ55_9G048700 [Panicum hallii var. hallii]
MFILLCVNSEVLISIIRKFRVHLLPCSNPEVPDSLTRRFRIWREVNFIRCFGVRCAYSFSS